VGNESCDSVRSFRFMVNRRAVSKSGECKTKEKDENFETPFSSRAPFVCSCGERHVVAERGIV
jgi:hypothetical protein